MLKHLHKNDNLLNKYELIFSEYLKVGILEDVTNEPSAFHCHYLTHRLCLHPYLCDILLRLFIRKTGLVGGIKKAFLQIRIDESHRNYLRSIWFDDANSLLPKMNILRLSCLVFGLPANPFILIGTVKLHLENLSDDPNKKESILKFLGDIYVNDTSDNFTNVDDAYEFFDIARSSLTSGNFELRKWACNDRELQQIIGKEESIETAVITTFNLQILATNQNIEKY